MKELRIQFKGDPVRILFAFDPKPQAVLLLGGAKTGDKDWYRRNVPLADKELTLHLKEIEKEKDR
jgi:hypothetical protein